MSYHRVVVKLGTNLLTAGSERLNLETMAALVGQIARLHREGFAVVVVSSGAIAAGRQSLPASLPGKWRHLQSPVSDSCADTLDSAPGGGRN